jgi:hypothetical protein
MRDCRHCGEYLKGDLVKIGSRCPRCREPLYERTDAARREREGMNVQAGVCAVHAGNAAVGACKRCGTFMCSLCRTRLDDRVVCLACVERSMSMSEQQSKELALQRVQALVAILLGVVGWFLALPVFIAREAGAGRQALVFCLLTSILSYLPTVFGLGMAAAAIRVRGDRMVAATFGLFLNGTQLGVVTGLVLLVIWQA